jgi:hypothetical protein
MLQKQAVQIKGFFAYPAKKVQSRIAAKAASVPMRISANWKQLMFQRTSSRHGKSA